MALLFFAAMLALLIPQYTLGRYAETKNDTGCHKPADIIIVLDASSSIWGPDFRKQLDFVKTVIRDLRVDPSLVRCGLVTYGDEVRVEFGLRTYSRAETAMTAVSLVSQLRGSTRTDLALRRMREMMEEDKRPGVPRIGIVLTDGQSDYPAATRQEAEMAHQAGIALIAVGIGKLVDSRELRAIASREDFWFNAYSFDGLKRIHGILTTKACEVQPPSDHVAEPAAVPQNTEGCTDKLAEVMFVLDGSASIWGPDFRSQLSFVREMVALFQVSESGTHVGVITFGDYPRLQFALDRYSTVSDVQRAVERIAQQMGSTNTAHALRYVRMHAFTGRRHRIGAIKIAVVITDGQSDDPVATAQEATRLKADGVSVFAIGVGSAADKTELYSIASYPSDQHAFMVENYAALGSVQQRLVSRTCLKNRPEEMLQLPALLLAPITANTSTDIDRMALSTTTKTNVATTVLSTAIDCESMKPADIVFSLPSSIDDQLTSHGLRFIVSVGKTLGLGNGRIRLGLTPRFCHAISGFSLEQGSLIDKVSRYVEQESPSGTVEETAATFRYLRDVSFSSHHEDRGKKAVKMAVVVVDRRSATLSQSTFREANRLKQKGIRIVVIVVGNRTLPFEEELSQIIGCDTCLLSADSYSGLSALVEALKRITISQLCTDNKR